MVNSNPEYLFSRWLDNELTTLEQHEFEDLCLRDEEFAARVDMATQLNVAVDQFEAPPMPAWDKERTFIAQEKSKWWQWQGLPAMSMAMSFAAMAMVISGFTVKVDEGSITMGFSQQPSKAEVAALVNEQLVNYQQSNQAMFAQYVDALQQQQQDSSAQLTQYLLQSSRQERREDFAQLVEFINEQRDDDQRYYTRQLAKLQREINSIDSSYPVVSE